MITREDVENLLTAEIRAFLSDCIRGGLADYDDASNYSDVARRDHTPAVRAIIRNCHMVARANRAALEVNGVRAILRKGRPMFVVRDRLCVSFKKLNRHLRPRYVRTRQATAFASQTLWTEGEMPAQLTNVVAGYVPDAPEAVFEIWMICPGGERNMWALKLSGAEIVELTPTKPGANEGMEATPRRAHIRPGALRKDGTDASG